MNINDWLNKSKLNLEKDLINQYHLEPFTIYNFYNEENHQELSLPPNFSDEPYAVGVNLDTKDKERIEYSLGLGSILMRGICCYNFPTSSWY